MGWSGWSWVMETKLPWKNHGGVGWGWSRKNKKKVGESKEGFGFFHNFCLLTTFMAELSTRSTTKVCFLSPFSFNSVTLSCCCCSTSFIFPLNFMCLCLTFCIEFSNLSCVVLLFYLFTVIQQFKSDYTKILLILMTS